MRRKRQLLLILMLLALLLLLLLLQCVHVGLLLLLLPVRCRCPRHWVCERVLGRLLAVGHKPPSLSLQPLPARRSRPLTSAVAALTSVQQLSDSWRLQHVTPRPVQCSRRRPVQAPVRHVARHAPV